MWVSSRSEGITSTSLLLPTPETGIELKPEYRLEKRESRHTLETQQTALRFPGKEITQADGISKQKDTGKTIVTTEGKI